jgi:predicted peptidase
MKKSIVYFISGLIGGMIISCNGFAQDTSLFEKRIFVSDKGDSLPYRILFPENYNKGQSYPMILFLHGAGERGVDNEKQLTHGADLFLEPYNRENFPAIVLFPQCPEDKYWIDISIRAKLGGKADPDFEESINSPSEELATVNDLVEQILARESVDKKKLYVMGLSMGGFGTFETLARWPDKYSGAVAICGGGNISLTKNYADETGIWITHGAKDDVVPVILSQRVYHALKGHGADVRYTEFPEANHNAWGPTFAMPELLPWLFSNSK